MTTTDNQAITHLPLNQLVKSPYNVRQQAPTGIEELADNIDAAGLLHNLVVHPIKVKRSKMYGVAAGQRRLLALQCLHERGRLAADFAVPVKVIDEDEARLLSFSENAHREAMHPADQIDAFAALADKGHSIEYISSVFGVTPLTVQRRLKLASLSPRLLALLREDAITLEQLAVLALIDGQAAQEELWFSLNDGQRSPHSLRRLITANEIDIKNDRLAKFVGVAAYEAAGGIIRRDLFADGDDGGTMTDAPLLHRLANEKMMQVLDILRAEGWKWGEATLETSLYDKTAKCRRLTPSQREWSDEEQQAIAALEQRIGELTEQLQAAEDDESLDSEAWQALSDEHDAIDAQIEAMQEARQEWTPEVKAQAGVFVSLSWEGEPNIQRGFQRIADQPAEEKTAAKPIHSDKLARRLNARLSSAVQTTLTTQPDKALLLLAHKLVCQTFDGYSRHGLAEGLRLTHDDRFAILSQHAPELADDGERQQLNDAREAWQAKLPEDFSVRIDWLAAWPQAEVLALLAYCVAVSYENPYIPGGKADPELMALQTFLGLDMRQHWTPTRDSYLNHVNKARLMEIAVAVGGNDAVIRLTPLKKADAAAALETMLDGSGWLPPGLNAVTAVQPAVH